VTVWETLIADPDHCVSESRFLPIGMTTIGRLVVVAHTDHARIRPPEMLSVFLRDATGEIPQPSASNDLGAPVVFLDCRLTQRCSLTVD